MKKKTFGQALQLALTAVVAALANFIWSANAFAEGTPGGTLKTALDHMPEKVFAGKGPNLVHFVDIAALQKLGNGSMSNDVSGRLVLAPLLPPVTALFYGGPQEFSQKSGTDLREIRYFASAGTPSDRSILWGMKNVEAVEALLAKLRHREFKELGGELLANGEPRNIDLGKQDRTDPWRGTTGQSYVVTANGDALIQAMSVEGATDMRNATPDKSVGRSPILDAALEGLASRLDAALLIQAIVVMPDLGQSSAALDSFDSFVQKRIDITGLRDQLEAKMKPGSSGLPVFFAGVMADVQRPKGPALIVSLTYADCPSAQKAVNHMRASWAEQVGPKIPAETAGTAVATAQGCAAIFEAATRGEADLVNRPFSFVVSAMMKRDLDLLRIGG